MEFQPIGLIRTPYPELADMPVQPAGAQGVRGSILLSLQFAEGLHDLDGFSHIIVLYHFHLAKEIRLTVTPFLDDRERGLFATRAPCRPNPIGLSVLRLRRVVGSCLEVEDVDMLDGTPLLDIKPYVPAFGPAPDSVRVGWLEDSASQVAAARSDERFKSDTHD